MSSSDTAIARLLVEIGMLGVLPATEDVELEPEDVLEAFVDFGVAVSVDADDHDDIEAGYRQILEAAAACSGGVVVITDVRLDNGELHWVRNGEPDSWHVDDFEEYLDHLAVFEFIDRLEPDDDRVFHSIGQRESGDTSYYVLADPKQAEILAERFGFDFDA
jgi:hypothetical protein